MPPKELKPFQDKESKDFIENELEKRLGMNIVSTEYVLIGANDRSLTVIANNLAKNYVLKNKVFPLFFLLNAQYAIKASDYYGAKHATVIAITKNKDMEDKKYNIYFFDPNGLLDVETNRHDFNIHTLLTKLSLILNPKDEGKYCEFMSIDRSRRGINYLYGGYCDALSLWFIYINRDSSTEEDVIAKFKQFHKTMDNPEIVKKETANILKNLRELGKK